MSFFQSDLSKKIQNYDITHVVYLVNCMASDVLNNQPKIYNKAPTDYMFCVFGCHGFKPNTQCIFISRDVIFYEKTFSSCHH